MSQNMVEYVLGRMITDALFRKRASESLNQACLTEGYNLSSEELQLLSAFDVHSLATLEARLDPALRRAAGPLNGYE